ATGAGRHAPRRRGDVRSLVLSLLALPPHRIADLGIGRTFQNLALFPTLTVLQNVMIGVHSRTRSDFLSNALRLPWVGREEAEIRERARELLAFLDLTAVAAHPAAGLPFGTLKRVELARALAGAPALLLVDEPAGGLMGLLEARGRQAQYGWTKVLHGIDFAVEEGGITTILGANGAGKTTTLRAVCGMVRTAGEIRFAGQRINGRATEDLVRLGIG